MSQLRDRRRSVDRRYRLRHRHDCRKTVLRYRWIQAPIVGRFGVLEAAHILAYQRDQKYFQQQRRVLESAAPVTGGQTAALGNINEGVLRWNGEAVGIEL